MLSIGRGTSVKPVKQDYYFSSRQSVMYWMTAHCDQTGCLSLKCTSIKESACGCVLARWVSPRITLYPLDEDLLWRR